MSGVEARRLERVDSFAAVAGDDHAVPSFSEHALRDALVDRVVLGQQDRQRRRARAARRAAGTGAATGPASARAQASSSGGLNGLLIRSTCRPASATLASIGEPGVVIGMKRMPGARPSRRARSANFGPSMPGMWWSTSASAGASRPSPGWPSADKASNAPPTACACMPQCRTAVSCAERLARWSSTMSTRRPASEAAGAAGSDAPSSAGAMRSGSVKWNGAASGLALQPSACISVTGRDAIETEGRCRRTAAASIRPPA